MGWSTQDDFFFPWVSSARIKSMMNTLGSSPVNLEKDPYLNVIIHLRWTLHQEQERRQNHYCCESTESMSMERDNTKNRMLTPCSSGGPQLKAKSAVNPNKRLLIKKGRRKCWHPYVITEKFIQELKCVLQLPKLFLWEVTAACQHTAQKGVSALHMVRNKTI